jgi:3-oxoacyl-[acyl-carrier protein] reductase
MGEGDMGQLHNQVALITGAGRGIGRAIALAYAKEGARLALAARTTLSALEQTAQEAQALGAATDVMRADVSDPAQVEDMIRHTVDRFATIDILVNNAGIAGPVGPLQENNVDAWVRTIQVNLIGTSGHICAAGLCCLSCVGKTVGRSLTCLALERPTPGVICLLTAPAR